MIAAKGTARRRALPLLLLALVLLLSACGGSEPQSRELPFSDVTAGKHSWELVSARLTVTGKTARLHGGIINTGAWTTGGVTMYVSFLDANGQQLVAKTYTDVFEESVGYQGQVVYDMSVDNFFNYDQIASVAIEFD